MEEGLPENKMQLHIKNIMYKQTYTIALSSEHIINGEAGVRKLLGVCYCWIIETKPFAKEKGVFLFLN